MLISVRERGYKGEEEEGEKQGEKEEEGRIEGRRRERGG